MKVYTWNNVLAGFEIGCISVIANDLDQARSAAMSHLSDSDDQEYVQTSEPSSIEDLIVPMCFVYVE